MKEVILTVLSYWGTCLAVALTPHNWQPIPIALGFCALLLTFVKDAQKETS